MSTRESIDWGNDAAATPDWHVEPVCPTCTIRRCGCPTGDQLEAMRMQHWDSMGCE